MEIRRSGKIAVGIIAALGTIGALHFLVFQERASEYNEAKAEFDGVRDRYASQGSAPNMLEIRKFRYQSLKYKMEYWRAVSELNIAFPNYYTDLTDVDETKQRQEFWDILHELEEAREEGQNGEGPQLSFLGNRGWNLTNSLPDRIIQQGIAVEDVMAEVRNENRLLNSLDQDSRAYQLHSDIYRNLLNRVGMSERYRDLLLESYGGLAATVYVLNRIEIVMESLPDDFWLSEKTPTQRREEMYELLRLEWPKGSEGNVDYHYPMRQGRALLDMIDAAGEYGIDRITYVKAHPVRPIEWEEPKSEEEEEEEEEEQQQNQGAGQWGGFGYDPLMGGMGGAGFGQSQEPEEPEGETVAYGVPLEILVEGSNSAVMSFFYRNTHARKPYELDRVRFRSDTAPDAPVQALGYINVVGYATFVGTMIERDVQRRFIDAKRELYELATQNGARDLALEDEIVRQENGEYVLVEPMPTPVPGEPVGEPDIGGDTDSDSGTTDGQQQPAGQPGQQPGGGNVPTF